MATEQLYLGGDRRSVRPWVVGLVIALGAAAIAFWLIAGDQDRSRTSESSTRQPGAFEQPPQTIEQPADNVVGGAVETSELFAPKDPFDSLISTSSAAGGRAAGASSRASKGGTGVGEHKVLLVAASSRRGGGAEVQVNGVAYAVSRGETFAENFKLLAASSDCVAMLFGDQEFTLCEGDEILK
ncbi:MAG: hypothetical protein ACRDJS_04890 [Actinomycetota bacterium]